jgi:hypothetical protein
MLNVLSRSSPLKRREIHCSINRDSLIFTIQKTTIHFFGEAEQARATREKKPE